MSKIFITGATGYIGYQLIQKLSKSSHSVHTLIRKQSDAVLFKDLNITLFYGDIRRRETIREAIKDCEYVYHVAAYAKLWAKDPSLFYEINVRGTNNVLQEALDAGVKKFVYTSSTGVFGPSLSNLTTEKDPRIISFRNDYDLSKQLAENLVKEFSHKGLFGVIVSPSRVYGPGLLTYSNAFCRILSDCLRGKFVFIPYDKKIKANYAFIDDVVDGHIKAMHLGIGGEKYILGGENITYEEAFHFIKSQIKKIHLIPLSLTAIKALGYIELLRTKITGKEPLITPDAAKRFFLNTSFSCQKAKSQLGYSVTPFAEGLKKTIDYIKTVQHGK